MIDKIEVYKNYITLTPERYNKNLPHLIMSHGSGGISDIDLSFASIATSKGYKVIIIDHFTIRGIDSQKWGKMEMFPSIEDRVSDILKLSTIFQDAILFGISGGGTAVIECSKDFKKSFVVYPALPIITESMLQCKNLTVVSGIDDDWCPIYHARKFKKYADFNLIEVPGFHAFLNPREDRFVPTILSLRGIDMPIPSNKTIYDLEIKEKGVTLKYNESSANLTRQIFKDWLP
jgi:dienelactone hydrolase